MKGRLGARSPLPCFGNVCFGQKAVVNVVVRLSTSSGASMRFVALVPRQEPSTEDAEQCIPGGFHTHYLPCKNYICTSWRKEVDRFDTGLVVGDKQGQPSAILKYEPGSISAVREMIRKSEIMPYSPISKSGSRAALHGA